MASLLTFLKTPARIRDDLRKRNELAEIQRCSKFLAARRIQSWFRGMITRAHLRTLNKMATIIQRHWRGYRARQKSKDHLRFRVHQMWQDHYEKMATRIQAVWRGYWSRKTRANLREMWAWLEKVYERNEQTLKEMQEFRMKEIEREKIVLERESILWILFVLFKLHHLMGTKHRPGVIRRIDEKHFMVIEEMLKCLRYRFYVAPRRESCEACRIDSKDSLVLRGTRFERCEREIRRFQRDLQDGNLSINRSERYEEEEKFRQALNHLNQILSIENRKREEFDKKQDTQNHCMDPKKSSQKSKTINRKSLKICK